MNKMILPGVAAVLAVAAIATVVFIPKNGINHNAVKTVTTSLESRENGILINSSDISADKATVLSYSANGTDMELLAVKDSDGNIDVAFNTCQVCNGSPWAYFEQENGILTCQNCGNQFPLSAIGQPGRGCNPLTIEDKYITETADGIVISKEYLDSGSVLFTNWKKS